MLTVACYACLSLTWFMCCHLSVIGGKALTDSLLKGHTSHLLFLKSAVPRKKSVTKKYLTFTASQSCSAKKEVSHNVTKKVFHKEMNTSVKEEEVDPVLQESMTLQQPHNSPRIPTVANNIAINSTVFVSIGKTPPQCR